MRYAGARHLDTNWQHTGRARLEIDDVLRRRRGPIRDDERGFTADGHRFGDGGHCELNLDAPRPSIERKRRPLRRETC